MFSIPMVSSWAAFHPGISHFPIVLLIVAPIFVLASIFSAGKRQVLLSAAFWLTLAGTITVYLSASTGDAAKEMASKEPAIVQAIDQHETLGAIVRVASTAFTILLAGFLYGLPVLKKHPGERAARWFAVAYLLLCLPTILILLNAAHSGGLLVHKLGVHAPIS